MAQPTKPVGRAYGCNPKTVAKRYIKKGMSLALARMQYERFIVIYLCNLRPKPSDVHQKPSDAHPKSSDAHPKASDDKRRDNR